MRYRKKKTSGTRKRDGSNWPARPLDFIVPYAHEGTCSFSLEKIRVWREYNFVQTMITQWANDRC